MAVCGPRGPYHVGVGAPRHALARVEIQELVDLGGSQPVAHLQLLHDEHLAGQRLLLQLPARGDGAWLRWVCLVLEAHLRGARRPERATPCTLRPTWLSCRHRMLRTASGEPAGPFSQTSHPPSGTGAPSLSRADLVRSSRHLSIAMAVSPASSTIPPVPPHCHRRSCPWPGAAVPPPLNTPCSPPQAPSPSTQRDLREVFACPPHACRLLPVALLGLALPPSPSSALALDVGHPGLSALDRSKPPSAAGPCRAFSPHHSALSPAPWPICSLRSTHHPPEALPPEFSQHQRPCELGEWVCVGSLSVSGP